MTVNARTLLRQSQGAARPWESLDALEAPQRKGRAKLDSYGRTPQREIEACLHCPFPSCSGYKGYRCAEHIGNYGRRT